MPARRIENTIHLSGVVGGLPDEGFGQDDVIRLLAETAPFSPVTIRLNSGGGDAFAGSAIHAILARDKARISVIVEGVAASAASLIAIAGNRLHISAGALFMVHDVATVTIGDVGAHERSIEALERLSNAYAQAYAQRTGKPVAQMRDLMKKETWLDGKGAVDLGFAHSHGNEAEKTDPSAFAYAAYRNAPQRLAAMARERGWTPHLSIGSTARPPVNQKTDTPELRERSAKICEATAAAGVPGLAARLIRLNCTLEEAQARITAATTGIDAPNVRSFDKAVAKLNGDR